jgi:hypothetical protein
MVRRAAMTYTERAYYVVVTDYILDDLLLAAALTELDVFQRGAAERAVCYAAEGE